jgi:hypothetical protein
MDYDPPAPICIVCKRVLENISHPFLSLSHLHACPDTTPLSRAFLPSLSLTLACLHRYSFHLPLAAVRESVPTQRPQHERGTTWRPEWPSTRWHSDADGHSHERTSAARAGISGSPMDLALSPGHTGATSLSRRIAAAVSPQPTNAIRPLPLVNSTCRGAFIFLGNKEMLRYAESACCKRMFLVFQIFQRYVSNASY